MFIYIYAIFLSQRNKERFFLKKIFLVTCKEAEKAKHYVGAFYNGEFSRAKKHKGKRAL